jgi:hypothetical protein
MNETVDTATRSLIGIDADLLMVGATLLGPALAVAGGLIVFRFQQQSQHAAERFLVDGIQDLYGTLSTLLSIHLQNYQIANYVIRTMKTYDRTHPLAPQPDEIPQFLGLQLESLPIDSLLPVQELLGEKVILDWVMLALSDVTLEAKEFEFQIRQPTAAYYRRASDSTFTFDVETAAALLKEKLELWESRLSRHFALLDRLHDLETHLGKKRPWTLGGFYRVCERAEVKTLVDEIKEGYQAARKAHEDTEDRLRGSG